MKIEDWINQNFDRVKQAIIEVLTSLSKTTIAVIFDEECAKECSEGSKMHDCFTPFLTDAGRVRTYLRLVLVGFFYSQAKQFGFEEIFALEFWTTIAMLHADFLKWKEENCKSNKKKEKSKVDAYVK